MHSLCAAGGDVREQIKEAGTAFINVHEMGVPEAAYIATSTPMFHSSHACIFVNTFPLHRRTHLLS